MTTVDLTKFADVLRRKIEDSPFRSHAEFARASNTSKQNVSRILTLRPHGISSAKPTVQRETVVKWAEVLNWDVDEALCLAGFAPQKPNVLTNERLVSIDFSYEELQTEEYKERAGYLFEMLEREIELMKREEALRLAGNDAKIDRETGETRLTVKATSVRRQGNIR